MAINNVKQVYSITVGFSPMVASGNPFKCHEEFFFVFAAYDPTEETF